MSELKIKKIIEDTKGAKHCVAVNDEGELFLMSEFSDREAINLYMPHIAAISDTNTPGFVKWFSENSALHVIFKYSEGTPLLRFLEKERLSLKDKLTVLKKIAFNAIELEAAPLLVQKTAVMPKNIVISEGDVLFNRIMDYPCEQVSKKEIFLSAHRIICEIFTYKELAKNAELKIINEKCEKNIYASFAELLRDLELLQKSEDGQLSLKASLMKKHERSIKKFGAALAVALIVISAIIVVYQYIMSSREGVPVFTPVEQIGGVVVWDGSVSAQNGDSAGFSTQTVHVFGKAPQEDVAEDVPQPAPEPKPPEITVEADPPEPQYIRHVVEHGDTVSLLCLKYYGNMDNVENVAKLNAIENPDLIYPGQIILLPKPNNS